MFYLKEKYPCGGRVAVGSYRGVMDFIVGAFGPSVSEE